MLSVLVLFMHYLGYFRWGDIRARSAAADCLSRNTAHGRDHGGITGNWRYWARDQVMKKRLLIAMQLPESNSLGQVPCGMPQRCEAGIES